MIILTDLSEVLIHGMQGTEKIVEERYGERTGEKFYKRSIETQELFLTLLRGNICEDVYWLDFIAEDYWPFNHIDAKSMFEQNLARPRIPGTLEVFKSIKAYPKKIGSKKMVEGHPQIYIVSDHILGRVKQVKKMHPEVFEAVDGTFWSCDLGMVKSDKGFFDAVQESLGVESDEIVFIDDWDKNTNAARRKRITSIDFRDSVQLMCELKELGFKF